MSSHRPGRAARRQRQRLDARELGEVRERLIDRGLRERIASVTAIVHPTAGSLIFWHALKSRIRAVEAFAPITSPDQLRAIAVRLLAQQHGLDMTGIILKVWIARPGPVVYFDAAPDYAQAVAAVIEVQGSASGGRRAAARAQLAKGEVR